MKITSKNEEVMAMAQAKSLIGHDSPINKVAIMCSIIRSVLWMDSKAHYPIHTTRIINQAIKLLINSTSESNSREEIKDCIDKLKYAGDLAAFSKGRWLPATLREITIDSDLEESLLVGGVPSNVFPKSIRRQVIHHKQYRKIVSGLLDEIHILPRIGLNFWAQIPEDLEIWAAQIKGMPSEEFTASNENQLFEFYLPQLHKQIQKFRWKQNLNGASGKYLCRNLTVPGTDHYIAELHNGVIISLSNALPRQFISRMMYAEDFANGKSVIVKAKIKNGELIINLSNLIPLGEHTIFDALGDLNAKAEATDFIVWKFNIKYQSVIFDTLQRLKIKIEEE